MMMFVVGCGSKGNTPNELLPQYTVDLDVIAGTPMPFKAEIGRVVPLETTKESLLGDTRKVMIRDDKIYIHDRKRHRINIFSINGKYLGHLSRQGRGPGEYLKLTDFDIDGESVYVLSADNKKITQYSQDDFNKFVEIELPETATKICVSHGNMWVGDIFTYQGLQELSVLEHGEIKPFFKIRKEFDDTTNGNPTEVKPQIFFSSSEYVLFNRRYTGDVYSLDADGLDYLLKVNSKQRTSGNINDANTFNGFYSIYREGDMLLGSLWGKNEHPLFVMDLKGGVSSLCNMGDLGLPSLSALTSFEGQFVTFMSAKTFVNGNFDALMPNNVYAKNIDENSNPIMVMFSIVKETD